MTQKATAIYDFDGIPSNGEISLREGDIVTVLKTDVGDGWWEGMTPSGETGLFPESYVEVIHEQNGDTQGSHDDANYPPPQQEDDWSDKAATDGYYGSEQSNPSYNQQAQNYDNNDAWSEEWDDGQSDVTAVDNSTRRYSYSSRQNSGRYQYRQDEVINTLVELASILTLLIISHFIEWLEKHT